MIQGRVDKKEGGAERGRYKGEESWQQPGSGEGRGRGGREGG